MASSESVPERGILPAPWFLQHTGGGCTALEYTLPDGGYWLITADGDAQAPEDPQDPCCVGRYDVEGNLMDCYTVDTIADALKVVRGEIPPTAERVL